jgi:CheY-like chemotaxis protein
VLSADGGAAGLTVLAEHRVDAVLLDVMMPGMDGLTTFRRMQEDPTLREVPVVLVTARVQTGPRQVWDGLAIAGVIPKPFDPLTLGAEVSAMLGWA